MRVGNIFTKIAKSKTGQAIYKHLLDPKNKEWQDRYLPVIESGVISSFYIASTAAQKKKIDKDSLTALQIQNVLSFAASVALSIPLNKKISKMGEGIIKHLNPEVIPDAHKVISGIKIGGPIINSLIISRFIVASALVPLSSVIRNGVKNRQANKNSKNLDVKA